VRLRNCANVGFQGGLVGEKRLVIICDGFVCVRHFLCVVKKEVCASQKSGFFFPNSEVSPSVFSNRPILVLVTLTRKHRQVIDTQSIFLGHQRTRIRVCSRELQMGESDQYSLAFSLLTNITLGASCQTVHIEKFW